MSDNQIMCPICMDDIIPNSKNFTNTDCGHCFHTSCLMTNVSHNGFGCPYCREQMVEEPQQEDDDTQSDLTYITEEDELQNNTFTSMRMLFQRLEGEEVEEEPEEDQHQQYQDQDQDQDQNQQEEEPRPTTDMIMRKLIGQGITYEDLVKNLLLDHDEYEFEEDFEVISDNIFATVRISISNHQNQTTPLPEPEPRFRNIFTTTPMPNFASMTPEELKTICRDYSIRYRMQRAATTLTTIWKKHNPSIAIEA